MARRLAGDVNRCPNYAVCVPAIEVSSTLGCYFFNAGSVISVRRLDGIHLDRDQHLVLGNGLAEIVIPILTGS
jgi:hypothetical protein